MIFDLVKDFAEVLDAMPAEYPRQRILKLLGEAIRRDVHFINRHRTALFQCMWNTCWWYDCPEAAKHNDEMVAEGAPPSPTNSICISALVEKWSSDKRDLVPGYRWIRSLRPPSLSLGSEQKIQLIEHRNEVIHLAFIDDGRRLVSRSSFEGFPDSFDYTVRIWDSATGIQIEQLIGLMKSYSNSFTTMAQCDGYSPSFSRIAQVYENSVHVCDYDTRAKLVQLCGHTARVTKVAWSADEQHIVSWSDDRTVRVWKVESGEPVIALDGSKSAVMTVALSTDGRRVFCWYDDDTVRVWNIDSGECDEIIDGMTTTGTGPDSLPYRLVCLASKARVEVNCSGDAVAWFPATCSRIATHNSSRKWATANANQVMILELMGGEENATG